MNEAVNQNNYEDSRTFCGDINYSPVREVVGVNYVIPQIKNDVDFILEETILEILLKDRTMNRNVIWGTNDYSLLGSMYSADSEIMISSITGYNDDVIQSRVMKEQSKQNQRTRNNAEVFTPSWICNEQCNLIDNQWFGRKNVFNTQLNKAWRANPKKIDFPDIKRKTWKDYIDGRRMEITCGEAPYLASRYDAVSGEAIALNERIGFLDRKLRVVNENTDNFDDWYKWIERAYQSIYGYEYQGDSLLIARKNLLFTFIDNMRYKFNRVPTESELKKIATIISWNIWQMDGLTNTVPFSDERDFKEQLSFFEEDNKERTFCKIKDWRAKKIVEFASLLEGKNG